MCLPGVAAPEHAVRMEESVPKQVAVSTFSPKAKEITAKIIILVVLGAMLGFAQAWASSRSYKPNHVAGFQLGVLHGILMPAALPGLLMGNDFPIYAPNNSGRLYNIGYLLGVNTCGTLFFGITFRQPRRRSVSK
jgi:hypothetical protein